jgi:hypothetical protein
MKYFVVVFWLLNYSFYIYAIRKSKPFRLYASMMAFAVISIFFIDINVGFFDSKNNKAVILLFGFFTFFGCYNIIYISKDN